MGPTQHARVSVCEGGRSSAPPPHPRTHRAVAEAAGAHGVQLLPQRLVLLLPIILAPSAHRHTHGRGGGARARTIVLVARVRFSWAAVSAGRRRDVTWSCASRSWSRSELQNGCRASHVGHPLIHIHPYPFLWPVRHRRTGCAQARPGPRAAPSPAPSPAPCAASVGCRPQHTAHRARWMVSHGGPGRPRPMTRARMPPSPPQRRAAG
jgi:hypothetical protein